MNHGRIMSASSPNVKGKIKIKSTLAGRHLLRPALRARAEPEGFLFVQGQGQALRAGCARP